MQVMWFQSLFGGAKIPHALGSKSQNIKQKQHGNRFDKDFKNGPLQNMFFFFLKQNKTKLFSLIFVVWFCSKGFAVNLVLIYGLNQMMIS